MTALDCVAPFAPLEVTAQHVAELSDAIEDGAKAFRDYQAWRVARRESLNHPPSLFWCFVLAHAESTALRLLIARWLESMTGPPCPN